MRYKKVKLLVKTIENFSEKNISPFVILMLVAVITVFLLVLFQNKTRSNEQINNLEPAQDIKDEALTNLEENEIPPSNDLGKIPPIPEKKSIAPPLENHNSRITKKPFGIFITPGSSPVQPERFQGYHTGTDFEVFPNELNEEIAVSSICEGKIIEKRNVGGYGGVIIQSCVLEQQIVTVLYGHLSLNNESTANVGDSVELGQNIAVLGDDKSSQTDGERKHLHLAIHKGSAIELRGYVSSKSELDKWIDFEKIFESQTN